MAKVMNEELIRIRDNMKCGHCSTIFKGTDSQARHFKYEKVVAYCSDMCRHASQRAKLSKPLPKHGPCPTCGDMFESRTSKIFCSLKCYNKSDVFKEMIANNYRKGNESTKEMWAEKMKRICPVCKQEYRAARSHRQFCSRLCYRKYKADLFDAWIANPQKIALPQCYDEFMLQDKLPCLIDGCDWEGRHLSIHLNVAHGVRAADFKRAAGFNLSTGLISPDLATLLSERDNTGIAVSVNLQKKGKDVLSEGYIPNTYQSLEGKEHKQKSRMISGVGPERTCIGCGTKFTQSTPFGRTLYCTRSCRDEAYSKLKKSK